MTSPREPQERPGSRLTFDMGRWTLFGDEEVEDLPTQPVYIVLGPEVDVPSVDPVQAPERREDAAEGTGE